MLDVELGLYLLETVMPTRAAADAWTLFGGYPYGEAFGDVRDDGQRQLIRRGRHYLWNMRRRREWHLAAEAYQAVPEELRGYELKSIDSIPQRRSPSRAAARFDVYDTLLTSPPAFARQPLPIADLGEYQFPVRDRRYSVTFTEDLLSGPDPHPHDLAALPPGGGRPLEVTWRELEGAAAAMDAREADLLPPRDRGHWVDRLDGARLLIRDETSGAFTASGLLRVDRMLHLVGMVGAGKSTMRDILTYWVASQNLRVTIVVGDVAETLAVVERLARLGVSVAPILGHSTRERHIERLHRRTATAGAETMLSHDQPSFTYLSSACPLDAMRGVEAAQPLRIAQAPCVLLYPVERPSAQPAGHQHPR